MRVESREYRIALIVTTCIFALPIILYAYNGLNSRMLADDYCFATSVQGRGWAGAMAYYFTHWQGTYSSTGVQSAIALTNGIFTPFLPPLLILGWWMALIYLIWQLGRLMGFERPFVSSMPLATLLLYGFVEGAPTVFQSFYWTSGSVTYALPMVLFTFCAGGLVHIQPRIITFSRGLRYGVLAGAGASLLAGFSPIFSVFALGVIALWILGVWFLAQPRPTPYLLFLGITWLGLMMGTLIMVLAPGNSVRQALYAKPDGLAALIGINIAATASFLAIDLSAFSLVPNLILLVVGGWLVSSMVIPTSVGSHLKRHSRRYLSVSLGIALVLLFGIFLPTSYNISGFPPGRALIIPHVVMAVVILVWGTVMAVQLRRKVSEPIRPSKPILAIFAMLMVIGPIATTWELVNLTPKFQTFAHEWDVRDRRIHDAQAAGEQAVSVQRFSVDLADYVNVGSVEGEFITCLQDYYQIRQLVVAEQLED